MTIMILKNTLQLVHAGHISDFNLADTNVGGRPLFRMGDVPRNKMPQLKGFPRPGSVAELLPKDHNGKVCIMDQFLSYVSNQLNISISHHEVWAQDIRGSQRELVASKVAKHALKMLERDDHKKFNATYVVSDDETLLDGHHGWAAVRVYERLTNQKVKLNVTRVNCDIAGLLKLAQQFTSIIGVENKEGV